MKRRVWTKLAPLKSNQMVDWSQCEWKVIDYDENPTKGEWRMKGGGGGGGTTQTIQKADPPAFIQPYLEQAATQATTLFGQQGTPSYYPGSTVTPFSGETNQALQMITDRATNGSPVNAAAGAQLTGTLNGQYLNGNPALQGAIDNASEGIVRNFNKITSPMIDANFSSNGRYGSGIFKDVKGDAATAAGDQLRKVATDMSYQNYGDERQRQLAATALAPQIANQDYTDASQLASVGATKEGMNQAQLQESIDRYNYGQTLDQDKLNAYINQITALGGFGGTTTSNTSGKQASGGFGSSLLGGIGGAASGLGLASTLGPMLGMSAAGPLGIGLGLLGGIGGLFG